MLEKVDFLKGELERLQFQYNEHLKCNVHCGSLEVIFSYIYEQREKTLAELRKIL